MTDTPLLFVTQSYSALGERLSGHSEQTGTRFELGQVERRDFPDGEHYRRILSNCEGRDIVLLGGTISDKETLELYDLACALVYYGARRLTMVIPFFGYSTMERAEKSGEVVTAKARARLLSSVPPASYGNRVYLVDLHVQGITHYFEGSVQPVHLSARPLIAKIAAELGGEDCVVACTDAGRAKWVEALAHELGVTAAFVYKRRVDGESTEVTGVSAHVKGKKVVIYDDMIRTGSSLVGAARAYADAGALSVSAVTTHGVFPGDALQRLKDTGLFECIAATDSHPRAVELEDDFLKIHSIDEMLREAL